MAKNREAVTCNGRAAFYAAMWDDIRQCAMDNGWAVALHGSLSADMDIMAMPWVEDAVSFDKLAIEIKKLFSGSEMGGPIITHGEKPHGRVVATIPIWADFYLDISAVQAGPVPGRNLAADTPSRFECSVCGWTDWDTYTADNDEYNYCPGCGAKMDGGADNGTE